MDTGSNLDSNESRRSHHETMLCNNSAAFNVGGVQASVESSHCCAGTVPLRARLADGRAFNLSCRPNDAVETTRERVAELAGISASTALPRILFRGQILRDGGCLRVARAPPRHTLPIHPSPDLSSQPLILFRPSHLRRRAPGRLPWPRCRRFHLPRPPCSRHRCHRRHRRRQRQHG